jgi:hypothetical protein
MISRFFKRLLAGDDASAGSPASLRNVIVWLFIAMVAMFLTHPARGPSGMSDTPVPWPAALDLDDALSPAVPARFAGSSPAWHSA